MASTIRQPRLNVYHDTVIQENAFSSGNSDSTASAAIDSVQHQCHRNQSVDAELLFVPDIEDDEASFVAQPRNTLPVILPSTSRVSKGNGSPSMHDKACHTNLSGSQTQHSMPRLVQDRRLTSLMPISKHVAKSTKSSNKKRTHSDLDAEEEGEIVSGSSHVNSTSKVRRTGMRLRGINRHPKTYQTDDDQADDQSDDGIDIGGDKSDEELDPIAATKSQNETAGQHSRLTSPANGSRGMLDIDLYRPAPFLHALRTKHLLTDEGYGQPTSTLHTASPLDANLQCEEILLSKNAVHPSRYVMEERIDQIIAPRSHDQTTQEPVDLLESLMSGPRIRGKHLIRWVGVVAVRPSV